VWNKIYVHSDPFFYRVVTNVYRIVWSENLNVRDHFYQLQGVDNIRMDLQEVGCGYVDWIGLAQDRDRWPDACECGNEPSGSVKCGEFLD